MPMNTISKKTLLLCSFLLFLVVNLHTTPVSSDTNTKEGNSLIIVNLDSQLEYNLNALANHVFSLFESQDDAIVTIKTYFDVDDDQMIKKLIAIMSDLGISEQQIILVDEQLRTDHPYFTLNVGKMPKIQ